jgi:hypothetical protein
MEAAGWGNTAPASLDGGLTMNVTELRALYLRDQTEHQLQADVVKHLDRIMPVSVPWTAVDHAAKLTPRQAGDRKKRGVKRGQPDLRFILPPNGRSAEIELKTYKGRQAPEQKAWQSATEAAGGLYEICRSLAEVEGVLTAWGVDLAE